MQEAINESIPGQGYSYDQLQHIVVVMEDSGYAFNYIKYILKHTFPYLQIYMVQSCGFRGLLNTVKYVIDNKNQAKFNGYIDYCMIIYDAGNADFDGKQADGRAKDLDKIEKKIRLNFKHYATVQPQCFEEFIIQIRDIQKIIGIEVNNQLYDQYKWLMNNELQVIDFKVQSDTKYKQNEQIVEDQVQRITDKQSRYAIRHTSGYFGECWKKECINSDSCIKCSNKYCNDYNRILLNKRKYVIQNQLLYVIIRLIEMHMKHRINLCSSIENIMNYNKYIRQLWEDEYGQSSN